MITNVVCTADMNCDINLNTLVNKTMNIIYDPARFSGAQWKHPKIGGHCMVFSTGKMMVNGRIRSIIDAKRRLRRYARMLQRLGWPVRLSGVRVATVSASFKLNSFPHLTNVCRFYSGSYDPELFPAVMFTKNSIHFTCFQSGAVLMTGIKRCSQIREVCMPILLEIPFL